MNTLDLHEAAKFLKMHPEVLRLKAYAGKVPGRKTGKCWVFVEEHLADWVSGRYPEPRRDLQVIDGFKPEENKLCQSTSAKTRGGYNTPRQTADEYNKLLGLK